MRQMKIAYCEDELPQAMLLKRQIQRWADTVGISCHVFSYESAEEFLFRNEAYPFDLILIDIAMKEINGLTLARKIRETDRLVRLAFLTADKEFVFEGYEVAAVRYLLKPVSEEKLFALLEEIKNTLENPLQKAFFTVEAGGVQERVSAADVMYVEVYGHYTQIHCLEKGCIRVKESLGKICELILEQGGELVRCHRSCAVNIAYVEQIMRAGCLLSNGEEVPVSRNAYKDVNERFISYNR